MNNIFYVIYDDNKNVIGINREYKTGDNYFPIEAKDAKDFILGTKSFGSYYVQHDTLHNFVLVEKKFEQINPVLSDLYEVVNTNYDNDLIIYHNVLKKHWKFILSDQTKKLISKDDYNKFIPFYISFKEQYNYLIRTLECRVCDLLLEKEFNFETEYEEDYSKLKIITKKYFTKIGVRDAQN